jgi:hypothetical protein
MLSICRRDFYEETLDLDRSKGVPHDKTINCYLYVILCGITFIQVSCDTLTGEATFKPLDML